MTRANGSVHNHTHGALPGPGSLSGQPRTQTFIGNTCEGGMGGNTSFGRDYDVVQVENNTLRGNAERGVSLRLGGKSVSVCGNTIHTPQYIAVYVDVNPESRVDISGNRVTGAQVVNSPGNRFLNLEPHGEMTGAEVVTVTNNTCTNPAVLTGCQNNTGVPLSVWANNVGLPRIEGASPVARIHANNIVRGATAWFPAEAAPTVNAGTTFMAIEP
jgi:hypothetical protein